MIVLIAQLLWFGLCHYQYATAFTFNNLKHRPTYSNTYSNTFLLKTSLTAKTDQNNNVNCDKITSEEPTPFSLEGCTYCNDASSEVAPLRYLSENSEISFRGMMYS